jgi:hypothetical protein
MPTIDTPLGRIMIRATDIVPEISNQDWQWVREQDRVATAAVRAAWSWRVKTNDRPQYGNAVGAPLIDKTRASRR